MKGVPHGKTVYAVVAPYHVYESTQSKGATYCSINVVGPVRSVRLSSRGVVLTMFARVVDEMRIAAKMLETGMPRGEYKSLW